MDDVIKQLASLTSRLKRQIMITKQQAKIIKRQEKELIKFKNNKKL